MATVEEKQFMYTLFLEGVVGTKEFRAWLEAEDPSFASVRDADVDNEIDRMARQRREEQYAATNQDSESN